MNWCIVLMFLSKKGTTKVTLLFLFLSFYFSAWLSYFLSKVLLCCPLMTQNRNDILCCSYRHPVLQPELMESYFGFKNSKSMYWEK